jgi:hypothetical protein
VDNTDCKNPCYTEAALYQVILNMLTNVFHSLHPFFKKFGGGLQDHHAVCVLMYPSLTPESWKMNPEEMSLQYHINICDIMPKSQGHTIAQAVSRWLPTAVAQVQSRVWSSGICGGQSGSGAGFLLVLRFPLPIFSPPNSPSS